MRWVWLLQVAVLAVVAGFGTTAYALTYSEMVGSCPELASFCPTPTPRPTARPTATPTRTPAPTPTPTPRRTPPPVRCETGLGVKTLSPGETVYMCFTVNSNQQGVLVEVSSVNLANLQCGSVRMETTAPVSGHKIFSNGAQPGTAWFREVGKWSVKVTLEYGCASYKFNARLDNIDLH